MKGIAIAPDTDFSFEKDYPVFKTSDKFFIMKIYSNDTYAVCYEVGKPNIAVYNTKHFEFVNWLKPFKQENAQYFI